MATTVDVDDVGEKDLCILEDAVEQMPADSPVRGLLVHLHDSLAAGKGATLLDQDVELSPNQAADLIGVSRPFLLRFMRSGALPFTLVGNHQRITTSDLLEFNERRLAAGKTVAEARANAAAREQAVVEGIAPTSDEALAEL